MRLKQLLFCFGAVALFAAPSQPYARTEKPGHNWQEPFSPSAQKTEDGEEKDIAPHIEHDLTKLPEAVRRTYDQLLQAAKSGDIENLRPLLGSGDDETMLSLTEEKKDPIALLKSLSGDKNGIEPLAIMVNLLNAGYVQLEAGTDQEIYVWPYFFAMSMDQLNKPQMVELFQIVTAGEYEEMKEFGGYMFYRLGISLDGKWRFFITGD